jgi:hypothetical protein
MSPSIQVVWMMLPKEEGLVSLSIMVTFVPPHLRYTILLLSTFGKDQRKMWWGGRSRKSATALIAQRQAERVVGNGGQVNAIIVREGRLEKGG